MATNNVEILTCIAYNRL